jgi:hypothetical protein
MTSFRYFLPRRATTRSGMTILRRLVALIALSACSDITGLTNATPYFNAALYPALWARLTACSGIGGDLAAIHFYSTPHIDEKGTELAGWWAKDGNKIFLEDAWKDDSRIVMHEMMHAKLGHPGHPAEYFNGACGDLMVHR